MRSLAAAKALSQCNKCPPTQEREGGAGAGAALALSVARTADAAAPRSRRPSCHSARHTRNAKTSPPRASSLLGHPGRRTLGRYHPAALRGNGGASDCLPPPRRAGSALAAVRGAVTLQCKNDHPSQMLHVWQNSWKQVGSLSWPSASRIYRRRCPGCPWFEEILLPQNAPSSRGSD